jgi:hypothetical protein
MVLSWIRRSWTERQEMKTEDLPAELNNALAWDGESLAEHELLETAAAADANALPSALVVDPLAATPDPETSDMTDALRAILEEADALPDSATNRLASTVDTVALHELLTHVRGLRNRLAL